MTDHSMATRPLGVALFAVAGLGLFGLDTVIAGEAMMSDGPVIGLVLASVLVFAAWLVCGSVVVAHLSLRRFNRKVARMIAREQHPTHRHDTDHANPREDRP